MHSWNIYLSISKLTDKTDYAKHVVRNTIFSKAEGQDNNITGQTASAQVLFYWNVHLFATLVSIQGIWEVGMGVIIHHPFPLLVSQLQEMVQDRNLYQGYPLCNDDNQ